MTGVGQVLRSTALRLSGVVWLFGYVLVEIAAVAQGRSTPGVMFLANLPLLGLGIAMCVGLARLLDGLSARPA